MLCNVLIYVNSAAFGCIVGYTCPLWLALLLMALYFSRAILEAFRSA